MTNVSCLGVAVASFQARSVALTFPNFVSCTSSLQDVCLTNSVEVVSSGRHILFTEEAVAKYIRNVFEKQSHCVPQLMQQHKRSSRGDARTHSGQAVRCLF